MSETLKPCPFCGGQARTQENGIVVYWEVACDDCDNTHFCEDTEAEAIGKWNRRPADDALAAELARARAALERAFRDGVAWGSNVAVTDIDEAWRTSAVRAELAER